MSFSFKLERPNDVAKTIKRLKEELKSISGTTVKFEGNEESGWLISDKLEGTYKVEPNHILITISKKPVLYPNAAIERVIKDEFKKRSC